MSHQDSLINAIDRSDRTLVEKLLSDGISPNYSDAQGIAPLHVAVYQHRKRMTSLLLSSGADPNIKNTEERTPLYYAAKKGYKDITIELLRRGASANIADVFGWTPLHVAVENGHCACTNILLDHGADVNATEEDGWTPLHVAVENGHFPCTEILLDNGADVNATDEDGQTALLKATLNDDLSLVDILLCRHADPDIPESTGGTPLHAAAQQNSRKVLEALLKKGANPNAQTKMGWSPLHMAAMTGYLHVTQALVQHAADIDITDRKEQTPLLQAVIQDHYYVIQYLIQQYADLNKAEISGDTPLHIAAENESSISLRLLLSSDADPNLRNKKGRTPLHIAAKMGNAANVKTLLKSNATKDIADGKGWSSLHLAAWKGHTKVVKILKASGAKLNIRNAEGWIPLHMACMLGHTDIVDMLAVKTDLNSENKTGFVPLDYAYMYSHSLVIKNLQVLGATRSSFHKISYARSPLNLRVAESPTSGVLGIIDALNWTSDHHVFDQAEDNVKILLASIKGDIEVIRKMVQQRCDVNTSGKNGMTALHCAAVSGKTATIRELLQAGADLQAVTKHGTSVLHCACLAGRYHAVEVLVKQLNVDTKRCDREGFSPADYAALRGHHHITRLLLKTSDKSDHLRTLRNMDMSKKLFRSVLDISKKIAKGPLEKLRLLLECGVCDPHLQDEQGMTLLHLATEEGNLDMIDFLLQHGTLPTALTYKLLTAKTLAELEDFGEAVSLFSCYVIPDKSPLEKCILKNKLLTLITSTLNWQDKDEKKMSEAVKQCTSLLLSGAPLEPLCCHHVSAIDLAINTNCAPLLPLLLASGTSLTSTYSGLAPIQLACSKDLTPWVRVIITKAVENKLNAEIDFISSEPLDNILKKSIQELIIMLQGDRPLRAKFPDLPLADQDMLDSLLCRACEKGATMAAWWIWQRGGNIIPLTSSSTTSLHAAVEARQWNTVEALVRHMGANLFLPDNKGHTAYERISDKRKKKLIIKDSMAQEYRILNEVLFRTREASDQRELQQLILLYHVLALELKVGVNRSRCKIVLGWLTSALATLAEDPSWVSSLCMALQNIPELREDTFAQVLSEIAVQECDYSKLTEVIVHLYSRYDLCQQEGNLLDSISVVQLEDIQRKALKMCCEKRLPLFLHLLVSIASVSVNDEVEPDYGLSPLHLAARKNNRSALMYLLTHKAFLGADTFGNTFIHHAYMHGHWDIGDMLILSYSNKSGKMPTDLKSAFVSYVENYHVQTKDIGIEPHEQTSSSQVIRVHLDRLQKEWEEKGFEKSIKEIYVDYSKGESAEILGLVTDLLKRLMADVAAIDPIFDGELLLLGSSADDVRLYCPDEFDCNLVLSNISGFPGKEVQLTLVTDTVNYEGCSTSVKLSSKRDDIQQLLEGSALLTRFYNVIKQCLMKCVMKDIRLSIAYPGVKRTRVGVGLRLLWLGQEFRILHVDVDIVPTVQAPWPDELPKPKIESPFLNNVYISSTGDGNWRFSFARAENFIMKNLTADQRLIYLACKMIMTRLKQEDWVPKDARDLYKYFDSKFFRIPSPRGFLLKNSFFFELEMAKERDLWAEGKIKDRMKSIFRRMCVEFTHPVTGEVSLEPGKVKAYFGKDTQPSECGYGASQIFLFLDALHVL
ncbi:serine/threonine-protein phosphatase 6 regulatory ankyrin repeat subunit B-like isoform X2 [Penaeus japonicus]|uniref:serine/threonine-protein phosphatase 6 regulatory ankyrin repeat subunit B-like isoform X2 n=1 Tax=Penaeus japonicus TaxID=27405 RepID=UPI001C7119A1|nr:serine/threonine-protein phosphatase 6 regulatory ankyrin repeat subunit B-like isoform X2 [Penaeus japonicus]